MKIASDERLRSARGRHHHDVSGWVAIDHNRCQLKARLHSNGCTVSDRAWPSAIAGGLVQCTHPLVGGSRALPRLSAGLRPR